MLTYWAPRRTQQHEPDQKVSVCVCWRNYCHSVGLLTACSHPTENTREIQPASPWGPFSFLFRSLSSRFPLGLYVISHFIFVSPWFFYFVVFLLWAFIICVYLVFFTFAYLRYNYVVLVSKYPDSTVASLLMVWHQPCKREVGGIFRSRRFFVAVCSFFQTPLRTRKQVLALRTLVLTLCYLRLACIAVAASRSTVNPDMTLLAIALGHALDIICRYYTQVWLPPTSFFLC